MSWCHYCKQAKAYFDARGVPHTDYDIEKDSEAAAGKKPLGGNGVPFAVVDCQNIICYAPQAYDSALRKKE